MNRDDSKIVSRASTFRCPQKGDLPQYTFFVKKVSSDGLVVFLARKTSLRHSIPNEKQAVVFLCCQQ